MPALDDLTRDLKKMVRLAAGDEGLEPLLKFGLSWVKRLAPTDLTTIFLLEDDNLVVRAARGRLVSPKVLSHVLPLKKYPSVRKALKNGRAKAFTEHDHAHGEGDPFDGVLDLPHGHSCMVVPLCANDRELGVMTLDRELCEPYDRQTVDLLEIYGHVLAMAIYQAEQTELLCRLHRESRERERLLAADLAGDPPADPELTRSAAMREVAVKARQVAKTHTPVLILGETGTGKERMAAAIHRWSPRAEQPFLKINCAAIPENLLESELFGHVKGSFTGATRNRPGRFQMANGGTILLDEIGEMPMPLQAKLLRILQEGTFEPVGSDHTVKVDVRILAATHVDPLQAIRERRLREDLFYRLNVFPIEIPPLRKRFDDLPQLCVSLLADLGQRTGRRGLYVTSDGVAKLCRYHWPGNVRELGNVLERAAILAKSLALGPEELELPGNQRQIRAEAQEAVATMPTLTLDELQRRHIARVLEKLDGKIYGKEGAAAVLGLKPSTLQSRMKKLGIQRKVTVELDR